MVCPEEQSTLQRLPMDRHKKVPVLTYYSEDGDLLNPAVARPPLHHLDISGTSRRSSHDSSAEWELGKALDLGVGGTGIIGRRITVHRAAGRGLTGPIAEGIIGWN